MLPHVWQTGADVTACRPKWEKCGLRHLRAIVLTGEGVRAAGKDLKGVRHGNEAELGRNTIPDGGDFIASELDNPSAFHAHEVIMVGHPCRKFVVCTFSLEAMFHKDVALGEQVQCGIHGSPGDAITSVVHFEVELIGREMAVQGMNVIQHTVAFLRVTILLAFEIVGELLLKLLKFC